MSILFMLSSLAKYSISFFTSSLLASSFRAWHGCTTRDTFLLRARAYSDIFLLHHDSGACCSFTFANLHTKKMSSYYDVDAILTDAQKVPCTFELTVPGLGFLEGNMSGDMKQGSKVELPLWLGEMLALRYVSCQVIRSICYILIPKTVKA
jgi:hypothetical protein